MADITIRNLDPDIRSNLQLRAKAHHRSMEEEVRSILRDAVAEDPKTRLNLLEITRECSAKFGDVELELPKRGPTREPPDFSQVTVV
ncbi:MAG: plasmid stabilization protein [Gammaproteobacteria bacterium]|nr:plasmid stabilization protein [Gammaproteobacteria bacterium]